MTQPQAKPVGEVVLSGPGSERRARSSRAWASTSGCPSASPRRSACSTRSALDAGEDPHRLTVAAGLAMGAAA